MKSNTKEQIIDRLLMSLEAHHERQMAKLIVIQEGFRQLSRAQLTVSGTLQQETYPDPTIAKKLMAQCITAQLDGDNGPVL